MLAPLLILLPGTDGTGVFFQGLVEALKAFYETKVLSYPQNGDQSYEHLGRHLLSELPTDRDYILVGESFGGPLAIWLATHAAVKPVKLILGATVAASPFSRPGQWIAPLVPLARFIPLRKWQIKFMLFNGGHGQWAAQIFEQTRFIDRRTFLARVQSVLRCDMRAALAALSIPVLCLNATQDRLLPLCLPRHYPLQNNIRIVDLPLPHMIFQCASDTIAKNQIIPFLMSA